MVNCNNQCGWLQLSMRLDNSKMSFFSNFSLAGKTSGFKRPGSITNPNCGLPATGYPASHPYAVCPYIIPRAICQSSSKRSYPLIQTSKGGYQRA